MNDRGRQIYPYLLAIAVTLPGLALRIAPQDINPPVLAFLSGMAILGASFLLLWACDAAQADISQGLALAIVAVVAVLPEYSVDMYFTWMAGRYPEANYAHYAIANMTGANRLLIGIAWPAIAVIYWWRTRFPVLLERERRVEILFLGLATLYACSIPLKGTLTLLDGAIFIGIFVAYMIVISRRPVEECDPEGPAELLVRLPQKSRRMAVAGLFLFAAGVIFANAEPFSENLVATGEFFHINRFILVQWLAPLASEAPEFTVALMFASRGQAGMALGTLLSAKLNQWTLLVGMIPSTFAVAHGSIEHSLPMDGYQLDEVMLTAAQSLLGVLILVTMRLTIGQSILLFGLFVGQLITPSLESAFPGRLPLFPGNAPAHQLYTVMYLVTCTALCLDQPRRLVGFWKAWTEEILGRKPAETEEANDPDRSSVSEPAYL